MFNCLNAKQTKATDIQRTQAIPECIYRFYYNKPELIVLKGLIRDKHNKMFKAFTAVM